MKIKPSSGDEVKDAVRVSLRETSRANEDQAAKVKQALNSGTEKNDSIKLGVSQAISKELDPIVLLKEREAKIERIKQQLAAGTYNPSSEDVAQAVGEEILYEVLGAANSGIPGTK